MFIQARYFSCHPTNQAKHWKLPTVTVVDCNAVSLSIFWMHCTLDTDKHYRWNQYSTDHQYEIGSLNVVIQVLHCVPQNDTNVICYSFDIPTHAQDGFQVLCSPQAATSNLSFSTNDYIADSYHLLATVEAGLWKCNLGWSSCLPVPASPVGDERSSTSLRPHFRCTHYPAFALGSGEGMVKGGYAHVQGHSWNCAIIPESVVLCRRSTWSAFPPLCPDKSSTSAVRQTVYCWQSPDPPFGTVCQITRSLLHLCRPSVSVWKQFCSRLIPWRYHQSPLNYSRTFSGPLWKYMNDGTNFDNYWHKCCWESMLSNGHQCRFWGHSVHNIRHKQ